MSIVLPELKLGDDVAIDLNDYETGFDEFNVSGLPAGLTYESSTQTISGTTVVSGTHPVQISADHSTLISTVDFSTPVATTDNAHANAFGTTVVMKDGSGNVINVGAAYAEGQDYLALNRTGNGQGTLWVAAKSSSFHIGGHPESDSLDESLFPVMMEYKFRYDVEVVPGGWPSFLDVLYNSSAQSAFSFIKSTRATRVTVGEAPGDTEVAMLDDLDLLDGEWHTVNYYLEANGDQSFYIDGQLQLDGDGQPPPSMSVDGGRHILFRVNALAHDTARMHVKYINLYSNVSIPQVELVVTRQTNGFSYEESFDQPLKIAHTAPSGAGGGTETEETTVASTSNSLSTEAIIGIAVAAVVLLSIIIYGVTKISGKSTSRSSNVKPRSNRK